MQTLEKITEKTESLTSVIKRLGNPESTILLHSPCNVFQIPQVDGIIGYRKIGKCAVAIGDPICFSENVAELTKAFYSHCQECNLKVIHFLVHEDFAHWAIDNGCHTLIQAGEELSINPTRFQIRQKLRWKTNQAIQNGVVVKEYKSFDPLLETQMKNVIQTWLKERNGLQMHLGRTDYFFDNSSKRIFYSQKSDKIMGLLMLSPVDRLQGWVVSSYFSILEAPVGTTECLMCSTFDVLAKENYHFLCLGAISGSKIGKVVGLNPIAKALSHFIFKLVHYFFKLNARSVYLNKFHPDSRSTFLVLKDKLSLVELVALKNLLNVNI